MTADTVADLAEITCADGMKPAKLRKDGSPVSANWGGPRSNAGGKRPGAGRPRKHPFSAMRFPAKKEGATARVSPYKVGLRAGGAVGTITTVESLARFDNAWVYVADCGGGISKVGMTSDVPKRMKALRAALFVAHPVNPAYAKAVETLALRYLGAQKQGTEYVCCKPERAALAVCTAIEELRKVCHVDPREPL